MAELINVFSLWRRPTLRDTYELHMNKVLAYLNMHWYSYDFGTKHPEWEQRMADGKSYGEVVPLYGSGTTFCVNSPWRDWAYLLICEARLKVNYLPPKSKACKCLVD